MEGTAYFAAADELNDVLEGKFDTANAAQFAEAYNKALNDVAVSRGYPNAVTFRQPVPDKLEAANRIENERFARACKQMGIFSTASLPDNQAMWAYYCDNHKGVCFHLEWPDDIVREYRLWSTPVFYSEESRTHNRADDFRELLISVSQQNPRWSPRQIEAFSLTDQFLRKWGINSIARAISTKHADWKHEREMRILSPRVGALPLMRRILRSVIFTRTDFPEWGPIMRTLYARYSGVRIAQMTFQHTRPFVTSREHTFRLIPLAAA